MIFKIFYLFLIQILVQLTVEINPTQLNFQGESTLKTENQFIYFTIESKYTPACYLFQNQTDVNQFKQLIFTIQNDSIASFQTNYVFLYYLEIDATQNTLNHNFQFETQKNKYFDSFLATNTNYEGFWFTLEIMNDFSKQLFNITFYQNSNKAYILFQKILIGETLLIDDTFSFYLGDSKISQFLGFSQFQGPIEYQLIESIEDFFPQKQTSCRHNSGYALRNNVNFERNSFYEFTVLSQISKSYGITTWLKINQNQNYVNNFVNVIQIQQNPIFYYQAQIGGKLLQVSYNINPKQQFVEIIYQNYSFPVLPLMQNNLDPFEQFLILDIPQTTNLYFWHYFSISYRKNQISFNLNFVQQNQLISKLITNVYQFTDLSLVLHLGGNQLNYSNTNGNFVHPYFYDCLVKIKPFCHFSCETCFGPYSNQCLKCSTSSNRQLSDGQTCNCKTGFLEVNIAQCYVVSSSIIQETFIPLSSKQGYDQEYPEIVCSYGYFKYDDQCYACPKLNKQYFCPECIQYPNTWVFNPKCIKNYGQYNKNINSTFTQDIIFQQENMMFEFDPFNVYTFNDGKLDYCAYCNSLCITQTYDFSCQTSDYFHLSQKVMVICALNAILINGKCKKCPNTCSQCILSNQGYICIKNTIIQMYKPFCALLGLEICLKCLDDSKYFLNFQQTDCIICSIPNCKYCFQYIMNNPYFNSIYNNKSIYENEDLATGCVLCQIGQCESNNNILGDTCLNYYISQNNAAICLSANSFNIGVEMILCYNYLTKCRKCIQPTKNQYYCLECDLGYFVNKIYGICQSCQDYDQLYFDCYQVEETITLSKVYEITPLIFSLSHQYPGQQINIYQQIQVKQCIQGYQKQTEDLCVLTDSAYCSEYDYGCRYCNMTSEGTKRLTILNLKCSDCPFYCEYCKPRLNYELNSLNPFLNLTLLTQISLAYRCIQKSSLHENIFLDNQQQLSRLCSAEFPKCQLQFTQTFTSFSNFLSVISNQLVNQNLYYNLRSVNIFQIFIRLEETYLNINSFLGFHLCQNNLISQIPSLHTTRLTFNFRSQNIGLIFGKLRFKDFQEIEFIQAKIMFSLTTQSVLSFESQTKIKFKLENVIIQDTYQVYFEFSQVFDQQNTSRQYQISIKNPSSINITNVLLQNMSIINSTFLNLTTINKEFQPFDILYLYNVTFFNCSFFETNIMSLLEDNQYNIIKFLQLKFINCQFFSSYFLNIQNLIMEGEFLIEDLLISESQFYDSIFILLPIYSSIIIKKVNIEKSILKNTIFISAFSSLTLFGVVLQEDTLINSYFLKYQKISKNLLLKEQSFNIRNFLVQNNFYIQLRLIDLQQQNDEKLRITLFNITSFNLTSLNRVLDEQNYFYSIQAEVVIIERIQFLRQPGSKDFKIFDCSLIQVTETLVQSNIIVDIHNNSLNTLFNLKSKKVIIKNLKFYNQLGIDVTFILLYGIENLSSLNEIEIDNLDIQNLQLIKTAFSQISTFLQVSCQINQEIILSNSIFQNVILNELVQDTKISSGALAAIISDFGIATISDMILNNIFVLNSTNPVFLVQTQQINIFNIQATNINSCFESFSKKFASLQMNFNESNIQVNSFGGLFNIQATATIIKSNRFSNIVALQGGVFYLTTKQNGQVIIQKNIFQNITTNHLNPQEGKGGCIFINSENAYLDFFFENNYLQNLTSGFQAGAIYIKLSQYQSKFQISNLKMINVFSQQNSIIFVKPNDLGFDAISEVLINNIFLQNGFDEFCQFQEFFKLKISEIVNSKQISMFYFSDFNVKISNFTFVGFTTQPILYVKFAKFLLINQLQLLNVTHISTYLILIENNLAIINSSLLINQLTLQHSSLKHISINGIEGSDKIIYQLKTYQTIIENSDEKALIKFQLNKNLKYCHFHLLYFILNSCEICNAGAFNIQNFADKNKIRINHLMLLKNQCGISSCIIIENLPDNTNYNFIIQSIFFNNSANNTGVLKSLNSNLQVKNTSFIKNSAIQKGGAIFYNNTKKNLNFERVYLIEYMAQIGGAVYNLNLYANSDIKLYYFLQNQATIYANNLATQPTFLQLFINDIPTKQIDKDQNDKIISEVYFIQNKIIQQFIYFPSGTPISQYFQFNWQKLKYIKYNFSLIAQPQNLFGENMVLNNDSECDSSSSIFSNQSLDESNIVQSIAYNIENKSFSLNDLVFILNPQNNNIAYIQIDISCKQIQNFYLRFKAKSFKCQIGEYQLNSRCIKCDTNQGYYSIQKNSTSCKRIDIQQIKSTTGAMIELQPGYWRPFLKSDFIEECIKYSTRCLGGWNVADASCNLGAIGALCEQCDIYNIRGDGNFINGKNVSCSLCGRIFLQVIFVLLQSMWIIFFIGLTVNSNNFSNKQLLKLKCLYRNYQAIYKQRMNQTSTLIKLANNHFQTISLIESFQISVALNFENLVRFLGDSNYMISYQIDCSLPQITQIEYEYAHYILIIIYPFFNFWMYGLLLFILLIRKKIKYSKTYIYSAIIYLYCLNQQNLIKWGVSLIGKRTISGLDWIQANVSSKYNTETHIQWQIRFIYPMLGLFGIIIPLFLYTQLRSIKCYLENKNVCMKYSFLFNEYNSKSYFWEIIKMIQKISIVLIANYYEQFILVKGLIIFLIILLYYYICSSIQPYKLQSINSIDIRTSFILSLIIAFSVLLSVIQSDNIYYMDYPVQLIIIFLIFSLIEIIVHRIIKVYLQKLNLQLDVIRKIIIQKFPQVISQQFNCLHPFLELRCDQQLRIQLRYQKLKKYLKVQQRFVKENNLLINNALKESNQMILNLFNSGNIFNSDREPNQKMLD